MTFQVVNVSPGVVRNLLKTTYYLRIPRQESDNLQLMDRQGQTIPLLPNVDTEIFWKDFDVVSDTLVKLDRDKVLKIIRYPVHLMDEPIQTQKDGVTVVPRITALNFHGAVFVTDEGLGVSGIEIDSPIKEVPFSAADWLNDQIVVIPSGSPGPGQVGPHLLPVLGTQFAIAQFRTVSATERRQIDMDSTASFTTGFITVRKAPTIPAFDGVFIVSTTIP